MARDAAYRKAEQRIEAARRSEATELMLSRMELTEVPESIASLTQLQVLSLSYNQLTAVPESIGSLTQLQRLNLSNNQLSSLPESIGSLTQLRELNLINNQLNSLPESIGSLTQLPTLNLSNNQLSSLPESIGSLTQLRELNLSDNQLTEVPEAIASLTWLHTLDLSDNQLTEVPASIGSLTRLHTLNLSDNPFNPDLAAAYKQGTKAVLQYLRAKAEAQVMLNEAKLILIGEGEVGKSCLLGALRGDEWVDDRPTTHGIEIKPVIVTDADSGTVITLNGWDFGGQRVYRPTHQLFFSAPAVYLVVWKPREGPQQGFVKEWITLVKRREPDAKILVVATHGGPGQRQPDIDRQELLNQFGHDTVIDFFHVDSKPSDNKSCTGIAELKAAIASVAASLPEVGRSVPAKWQRVREALQASNKAYLPYEDVLALCQKQGIDEEQADLFVRISHTLGHLIHYHYDPTLRDIVILKPDWLAKAISFVLDDATTRSSSGLIEFDHLSQLWSHPPFPGEEGYPEPLHPVFLRLMERFDLSYKVVLDRLEPGNTSLIAQLVPDNRPEQLPNWGEQPEAGDRQQVQICRIVDDRGREAIAEGLFYQLIVRLHKYSLGRDNYNDSIHWQRGLMLDDSYNGRALLEYTGTDVKITVRAAYPEFLLFELTKEVKWLVEYFWEGLRCEVMVPCITPCGKNQPGIGQFEVQKLIQSKLQGMPKFPCMVSGCNQWLDIDELMRNAPSTRQNPIEKMLVEEFGEVKDRLNSIGRDIRKDIRTLDVREDQRFQKLDENDRRILSQADQQFADLMQMLTDEAKDGPRLFSFKPVNPNFFDSPKWIKEKFQLTLWCEHARQPLPALNPKGSKQGVYVLELNREWFTKAVPYFRVLTTTLSLVLPVAASATQFVLDDATYKGIQEELDLGQKSLELGIKSSNIAIDWQTKKNAPKWEQGDAIRAQGSILRELHTLLKAKDPSFGGLVRVQNKRREFLWVHPQFIGEY